jgi:hypothetical protein
MQAAIVYSGRFMGNTSGLFNRGGFLGIGGDKDGKKASSAILNILTTGIETGRDGQYNASKEAIDIFGRLAKIAPTDVLSEMDRDTKINDLSNNKTSEELLAALRKLIESHDNLTEEMKKGILVES